MPGPRVRVLTIFLFLWFGSHPLIEVWADDSNGLKQGRRGPKLGQEKSSRPRKLDSVSNGAKHLPRCRGGQIRPQKATASKQKPHCFSLCNNKQPVKAMLDQYAENLKPQWPGTVDLIVRTFSNDVQPLISFFQSVELFWPKNIGEMILVLDEGDEWIEEANFVPRDWRVEYEGEATPPLQGILTSYWSNYYTDKYCKSDYVAIGDSDMVFHTLLTPDLLFNLTTKKPYMVINPTYQREYFMTGSTWWWGRNEQDEVTQVGNAMIRLPIVYPVAMFEQFRNFSVELHNSRASRDARGHAILKRHHPSLLLGRRDGAGA
mmetsp:Transcript_47401/g.88307  ORF Transcript_47401/g.88307 Transcript_47401/m.88307 type:complete len:318 (+) Transcript_47401:242-1195(+)